MTDRQTDHRPESPPARASGAHDPVSAIHYSPRYDAALSLAASAHRAQTRKGSDTSYIVHPVHVSILLIRHGFEEDVAIAGLLHDVVEDSDTTLAEIAERFGPHVAGVVDALTEHKHFDGVNQEWEFRKRDALERLQGAGAGAAAVKAADVVHNAMTLCSQLRRQGAASWRFYKRGPEKTMGYYRAVARIVNDKLGPHSIAGELEQALQDLEHAIRETGEG